MGFWVSVTLMMAGSNATEAAEPQAEAARGAAAASVAVRPVNEVPPEAAAHCARSKELVGANCSFTTGMTARRVLEEGAPWSWVGVLTPTDNAQPTRIAAPYRMDDGVLVVATELLEGLVQEGIVGLNLRLEGRSLELDGVRYVVLTSFARVDT